MRDKLVKVVGREAFCIETANIPNLKISDNLRLGLKQQPDTDDKTFPNSWKRDVANILGAD